MNYYEIYHLRKNIRQRHRFKSCRQKLADKITQERYCRREHQKHYGLVRHILLFDKAIDHRDKTDDDEESDYDVCQSVCKSVCLNEPAHSLADLKPDRLVKVG